MRELCQHLQEGQQLSAFNLRDARKGRAHFHGVLILALDVLVGSWADFLPSLSLGSGNLDRLVSRHVHLCELIHFLGRVGDPVHD
jgi:hypothetical protein